MELVCKPIQIYSVVHWKKLLRVPFLHVIVSLIAFILYRYQNSKKRNVFTYNSYLKYLFQNFFSKLAI